MTAGPVYIPTTNGCARSTCLVAGPAAYDSILSAGCVIKADNNRGIPGARVVIHTCERFRRSLSSYSLCR